MASGESLFFDIVARDAQASQAFARFRNQIVQTSGAVDKSSQGLDRNTQALEKNKKAAVDGKMAAVGVGVAFSAMASPVVAAGVGVAAFSALAVPSVVKVTKALTGPGGLGAAWGTLDKGQQTAALGVQALGRNYSALAKAMEPQMFQVFNSGLGLANSLLAPTAQLASAAGRGIEDFLVQFTADSGIQQFVAFLAREARPALDLLGTDITNIAHSIFSLLESFGGVGLAELKLFSAAISGLTGSVTWLASHAGGLTGVAVGISGIALALSKLNLLSGALRITGLATMASEMGMVMVGARGATLAERALMLQTVALNSVSPVGWAVLAAAAIAALGYSLRNVGTSWRDQVKSMAAADHATGFNVAGYQKLAAQLGAVAAAGGKDTLATLALTGAHVQALAASKSLSDFLGNLQSEYHVTRQGAMALAEASGVQIDKNGKLKKSFAESTATAEAFANANRAAGHPVLGLAMAVSQLTASLNANVTAVLALQGDELAWRQSLNAARTQLAGNTAGLRGNSDAALANKAAVLASSNAAVAFAQKQLDTRQNLRGASAEIQNQISFLKSLHDKTGFAAAEIKILVWWLNQIKSERASIDVRGTGTWSVTQFKAPGFGKHAIPGGANGMFISQGRPGVDDQLIAAQKGELVVPTRMVGAGAVDHLRGKIPGFAAGGVVGSFADGPAGLGRWAGREDTATLTALANAVATSTLAGIRKATALGGASGNAIVRYAESFLGDPYVWGAAGPSAFDCSGLTSTVYHHFGIPAPRTSQEQQLWARPSGDRAGALAFFYGTGGTARHVGISTGTGMMINAANPALGVLMSSVAGNSGFGVPPPRGSGPGGGASFDRGGWLPPGLSLAYNGTGRHERVIPHGYGGGGGVTVIELRSSGSQVDEMLLQILRNAIRVRTGGNVQLALGR